MLRPRPLLLAAPLLVAAAGCSEPPPSVLLISLDSVRADALTFTDPAAAPRMTEFAQRGTIFTQAISGSSWTLPGHAQIFTGCPPALHGTLTDDVAIDPGVPTLPELLDDLGMFTAGYWTGWYVAGDFGFSRGFDLYENAMTGGREIEAQFERALDEGNVQAARAVLAGRDVAGHRDITSPRVVERAAVALDHVDADEPFFLFAHLFDPHYDYLPPAPWDRAFDPDYTGDVDGRDYYRNKRIYDSSRRPARQISDRDLVHVRALYQGEIGWTDQHVGELLDLLDARGRLDDTFVVITADHGEEFFEHGGRGHRHTLYDELLRVPLLIVPPRGAFPDAPRRVDAEVSLSDVMPTVLDFLGAPVPPTVQGRSLLPALRGAELPSLPTVSSLMAMRSASDGSTRYILEDALRTPTEKIVRTIEMAPDGRMKLRRSEYYDLAADPGEHRPVLDPADPRASSLWGRLEDELDRLRAAWDAGPRSSGPARETRVAELFEEELGDLGYAGEDGDGADRGTFVSPGHALPWGLAPPPRLEPPGTEQPGNEPPDEAGGDETTD